MSATPLMPAAFLGHGSPMNALERKPLYQVWRAFGAAVPRPPNMAVSAHWYVNGLAVCRCRGRAPSTISTGFPQALFDVQCRRACRNWRRKWPTPSRRIASAPTSMVGA